MPKTAPPRDHSKPSTFGTRRAEREAREAAGEAPKTRDHLIGRIDPNEEVIVDGVRIRHVQG